MTLPTDIVAGQSGHAAIHNATNEKVNEIEGRTITAGTGLLGGGTLAADRTLALAPATHPSLALGQLRISDPSALIVASELTATTWDTYDGGDVIVHPSVRYFPDGFNGHRWWAAATPYAGASSALENPSIFVSDDGIDWVPPAGVTNPVVPALTGSDYNSDPCLVLGPDGLLYLFYREYLPSVTPADDEHICVRSSADGITWSSPTTIIATAAGTARLMSPAAWYDPAAEQWVLLGVEIVADPRVVLRYTATSPTGTWTKDESAATFPDWESTYSPWHIDAALIGGQVVMLVQDATADGYPGRIWLCTSDDGGVTFSRADDYLGGANAASRYKSCLSPRLSEHGLELDVWLGTHGGSWGAKRALLSTHPSRDWVAEISQAVLGVNGYVLGDAFSRADNGSNLGTAPTGQTWTNSSGTMTVSGGKAVASADANTRAFADVGIADYEITALVGYGSGGAYVCARATNSSNYLRFGYGGTSTYIVLQRITSGSATNLYDATVPAGPAHIGLRCVGSSVQALVDGVVVASVTETQGQTDTTVGIQADKTGTWIDDVTVLAL